MLDFFGQEEGFVPRRRAPAVLPRVELIPAPAPVQAGPVKVKTKFRKKNNSKKSIVRKRKKTIRWRRKSE